MEELDSPEKVYQRKSPKAKSFKTLTLEEIELKNKNISVDASLYLVNELGAFANATIKKDQVIAYYTGIVVGEKEVEDNEDLYALTVGQNKLIISPIAPYKNPSQNRLNTAPFCLASFANDPKGTNLPQNALFGSTTYKVEGHENMYAVELIAFKKLNEGDEIIILYGNGYWNKREYSPPEEQVFDEKGPYVNGEANESKRMPFKFYSYSIMNFSRIEPTLLAKRYDVGLDKSWNEAKWADFRRQILKGAMEYSLDSTNPSPEFMWNYGMNQVMRNLDFILHLLLKMKKYRFVSESPASIRIGLLKRLNLVISNFPSDIDESAPGNIVYDPGVIRVFLCPQKPDEGALCDFITLLGQEKFLTVFNANASNYDSYSALSHRINSERKSSYSLANTANLMTFVMLCFTFLKRFLAFVDAQSQISLSEDTSGGTRKRKSSRITASNIEDTFI